MRALRPGGSPGAAASRRWCRGWSRRSCRGTRSPCLRPWRVLPSASGSACRSDGEVGDLPGLAGDALLARPVAKLLDGHAVEARHHLLLGVVPDRPKHLPADLRSIGLRCRVDGDLELAHDADDLAAGAAA